MIWVYVLIAALILLEAWRIFAGSAEGMEVYAPLSVGLGLMQAVLLSCAAVGLYVRPVGSSFRTFFSDVRAS